MVFSLLPWVLADLGRGAQQVFYTGAAILAERYETLGLHQLLPTDRVWVGVRSTHDGVFGGFHHAGQGYRHLQMGAVVTRYGRLDQAAAASELVALDLLRAYAHDCLHFGSYREYQLRGDEVFRTRYGLNIRGEDGRTYSAPDPAGTVSTRNLGVVMEGATDREASAIARQAAQRAGVTEPAGGVDRFTFRDVTGRLSGDDLTHLPARQAPAEQRTAGRQDFLAALAAYARGVNNPYHAFLVDIGGSDADDLHDVIVSTMISGRLAPLGSWLDQRYGLGAFSALFRAVSYRGPEPE